MSKFDMVNARLNILESKTRGLNSRLDYRAFTSDVDKLTTRVETLEHNIQIMYSKHDELHEQFDMLMDHLGLRIENGPRIVKDK